MQLYVHLTGFYKKLKTILVHHVAVLFGLRSISWCGHLIHIADPLNHLLDFGIDPVVIPCPQDLLFHDVIDILEPGFSVHCLVVSEGISADDDVLMTAHHLYVGIVFIASSVIGSRPYFTITLKDYLWYRIAHLRNSWHGQLSINLKFTGSLSIACGHHIYVLPVYAFISDYPTVICLFYHHMWIAGFLIVGATAHASIFIVSFIGWSGVLFIVQVGSVGVGSVGVGSVGVGSVGIQGWSGSGVAISRSIWSFIGKVLIQRDVIIGHLIWVSIILGLHSLGLYIHNDSLQALARYEDIFDDNSIQLKPLFALLEIRNRLDIKIYVVDKKVIKITQELGTADFIVTHIHAFTIHVTLLILSKGILYARNSRLVSDKFQLGFRYPCDGPGRGGTCQISSWDHIFLGIFWMYNAVSVVLFHYYWKMQSDVWCILVEVTGLSKTLAKYFISQEVLHISGGDFSVNSGCINGWLRSFLWSQSGQVIQSYSSSISGYGFIFILCHFIWAFSLMFLYSGRGYWQELIESILWAHHKFKIIPYIQPRALSITQGRAVGLIHYILGGVGCSWSFFISRMVMQ